MSTNEAYELLRRYHYMFNSICLMEDYIGVNLDRGRLKGDHIAGEITDLKLVVEFKNHSPLDLSINPGSFGKHNFKNIEEMFLTFITDLKELSDSAIRQLEVLNNKEKE